MKQQPLLQLTGELVYLELPLSGEILYNKKYVNFLLTFQNWT